MARSNKHEAADGRRVGQQEAFARENGLAVSSRISDGVWTERRDVYNERCWLTRNHSNQAVHRPVPPFSHTTLNIVQPTHHSLFNAQLQVFSTPVFYQQC